MVRNLSKSDLLSGLIWSFLGLGLSMGSIRLKLGTFYKPGAGFIPFVSGTLLGLLGLTLIILTILKGSGEEGVKNKTFRLKERWGKFFITLFILFGYILLFKPLGFILTTFLFIFFLFKLTESKRWGIPMIYSGVVVIISYLLFSVWLKCPFPKGILNF